MKSKFKKLEELTFADDFIFSKVLTTNKDLCKGLLERLLHIEIADIEYPNREKAFKEGFYSHGVRLDVFVKNSNQIFDIEMQTDNFGELPQRARYYQSAIDQGALESGEDYNSLKESYIIFICTKDPIGEGKPIYTLKKTFEETNKNYNDKSHLIYYNINAFEKVTDSEVKAFLEFVKTGVAKSEFTRELMKKVEHTKMTDPDLLFHYRMVWQKENDWLKAGKREGIAEGEHKKAIETAKNLLGLGVGTPQQIAQATGLSLEKVEKLQADKQKSDF